ncbi:MAG: hypothetical protein AB7G21_05205 [Dehalococcoidia bacterium]
MALGSLEIRLIAREHRRRPFTGPVLQLGRQRIDVTPEEAEALLLSEGVTPQPIPADLPLHGQRPDGLVAVHDARNISDLALFAMFGITDVVAVDVSPRDHPEVIADLNYPYPPELKDRFDLIVDGGTFDHLFDLRQAFINVATALRPGGRIIQWNAASNYVEWGAYCSFSPAVFHDYYTQNRFADVRTFLAVASYAYPGTWDLFAYDYVPGVASPFVDPGRVMSVVWAERTAESTSDVIPTQTWWFEPEGQQMPPLRRVAAMLRKFRARYPEAAELPYRKVFRPLRAAYFKTRLFFAPSEHSRRYRHLGRF